MAKLITPYLVWRDGRPRWIPSPELRGRGFKGRDLRYPYDHPQAGDWMGQADAHFAARTLNDATRNKAAPEYLPPEVRTMQALFTRLKATPKFQQPASAREVAEAGPVRPGMERLKLGKRTVSDYKYHMERLTRWCGDIDVTAMNADDIEAFYHDQAEAHGLSSTTAMMRTLKIAMNYAVDRLGWIVKNPVEGVRLLAADGRCVIWELHEIPVIIAAADWCGLPSIGDAFILGLLAGQRRQDIIALPEAPPGDAYKIVRQRKRGAIAYVPNTDPLRLRMEDAHRRKKESWPTVAFQHEVINSRTGTPYHPNGREFGEQWRLVRGVAAGQQWAITAARRDEVLPFKPVPSCAEKLFMDTRDTAVTFLFEADCNMAEIANVTGHSLKTVQSVLDKHYFTRNAKLAGSAGKKLNGHLETFNIRWA